MEWRDPEAQRSIMEIAAWRGDASVDLTGRLSVKERTGGWKAVSTVYGLMIGESVIYVSISVNLVTYLLLVNHQDTSRAANVVTNFIGADHLFTFFWGIFSDYFLGRYWTTIMCSTILAAGTALLTVVTSVEFFTPSKCTLEFFYLCPSAGQNYTSPLYAALYMVTIGSGGVKSVLVSFGADQFEDSDPVEKKKLTHYFNYVILSSLVAASFSLSFLVYVQDRVGYAAGYGIGLGLLVFAFICFLCNTPRYRHKIAIGSPLTRMAQVIVAAVRNYKVPVPADPSDLYEVENSTDNASAIGGTRKLAHSNKLRFLDKAAIDNKPESKFLYPWEVCSVTQVEELKRLILLMPVWCITSIIFLTTAQYMVFSVQQSITMDRRLGSLVIPPASLSIFSLLTAVLATVFYDRVVVPYMRKITGQQSGITPLQRIGFAFILLMVGAVIAAQVEGVRMKRVRKLHLKHAILGLYTVPMTIWWILPQQVLVAASEIFLVTGKLEFFYGEAPDSVRGMALGFGLTSNAVGNFMSSVLVDAVNKYSKHYTGKSWLIEDFNLGGIQNLYYLLALISGVGFFLHLLIAHWYECKEVMPTAIHNLQDTSNNQGTTRSTASSPQHKSDVKFMK